MNRIPVMRFFNILAAIVCNCASEGRVLVQLQNQVHCFIGLAEHKKIVAIHCIQPFEAYIGSDTGNPTVIWT